MKIEQLNTEEQVIVIAEIGNNHEGKVDVAEELITLAKKSGADAVKFQTFKTEHYVSRKDEARFEKLKSFELTEGEFVQLKKKADAEGIVFLSTPFDVHSAEFLNDLVSAFKISSSDNTFYPLLERVAEFGKPILLSTGLADLDQISKTESFIDKVWQKNNINQEMAILHCVTSYPTKIEEANLKAIQSLSEEFGGVVGYSDHTLGMHASVLAVALGARIVEKHFTLDKNYSDFHDHQISSDPEELKILVERIRETEQLLGTGDLALQQSEQSIEPLVRRSIVAVHDMEEGKIIEEDDITWVRPSGGVAPGNEGQIVGKTLKEAVSQGDMIKEEHLIS